MPEDICACAIFKLLTAEQVAKENPHDTGWRFGRRLGVAPVDHRDFGFTYACSYYSANGWRADYMFHPERGWSCTAS